MREPVKAPRLEQGIKGATEAWADVRAKGRSDRLLDLWVDLLLEGVRFFVGQCPFREGTGRGSLGPVDLPASYSSSSGGDRVTKDIQALSVGLGAMRSSSQWVSRSARVLRSSCCPARSNVSGARSLVNVFAGCNRLQKSADDVRRAGSVA